MMSIVLSVDRLDAKPMQTLKSAYDRDSLEVPDEIPTSALRYILGSVHVATPPDEVEKFIRDRCKRNKYTEEQIELTVKAGLWIHAENLAEYKWVMKV